MQALIRLQTPFQAQKTQARKVSLLRPHWAPVEEAFLQRPYQVPVVWASCPHLAPAEASLGHLCQAPAVEASLLRPHRVPVEEAFLQRPCQALVVLASWPHLAPAEASLGHLCQAPIVEAFLRRLHRPPAVQAFLELLHQIPAVEALLVEASSVHLRQTLLVEAFSLDRPKALVLEAFLQHLLRTQVVEVPRQRYAPAAATLMPCQAFLGVSVASWELAAGCLDSSWVAPQAAQLWPRQALFRREIHKKQVRPQTALPRLPLHQGRPFPRLLKSEQLVWLHL